MVSRGNVYALVIGAYGLSALLDLSLNMVPITIEPPLLLRAHSIIFIMTQITVIPVSLVLSFYMATKDSRTIAILGVTFSSLQALLFVRISTIQFWLSVLALNAISILILTISVPRLFRERSNLDANDRLDILFYAVLALTLYAAYLREALLILNRIGVINLAHVSLTMSLDELMVFLVPVDGVLLFLSQLPGMRRILQIYLVVGSMGIAMATAALLFYNTDIAMVMVNHIISRTSLHMSGPFLLAGAGAFALFLMGLLVGLQQRRIPIISVLGILLLFSSMWRYGSPYFYGPAGIGALLLSVRTMRG